MDAISHLLTGPVAREAFVLRCSLRPPWSMRIADGAPLSVVALIRGHAYVTRDDAEPVRLEPGDVAVVRGARPYTVADAVGTEPQVRIDPGQVCVDLGRAGAAPMSDVGVRTWGNTADGPTMLLTGTYDNRSMVGRRLLGTLPGLVVARRDDVPAELVGFLAGQITSDEPGQAALLDRLLDLILIAVLRRHFTSQDPDRAGWYRAYADPAIGRALRLMHDDPARPWTVAGLGAETGLSRAAFARRFTDLVGEPPMAYLAGWRLSLAADLLTEPGATVVSVARRVGYATPFAFSAAFKRQHRVSPRDYRDAVPVS
jgi:AraC-like DNA-binding protein